MRRALTLSLSLPALALIALGCTDRSGEPPLAIDDDGVKPTYQSTDVHMRVTDDGLPRVEIEAGRVTGFELQDSSYAILEPLDSVETGRVTVRLFEDGTESAVLTALRIVYHDVERRMVARGDVHVRSSDGSNLACEHLVWTEATRQIQVAGFSRFSSKDHTLQGYGLTATEDLKELTMRNPVITRPGTQQIERAE